MKKIILALLLLIAIISTSLSAANLMAIHTNKTYGTILHQLTSIDSLTFSPAGDKMFVNVKGILYDYEIASIDSIYYMDGGTWSDSLTPAILVTSFGVIGDGTTNNKVALDKAIIEARGIGAHIYFPNGNYLYKSSGLNAGQVRFIGQNRTGTILKDLAQREHSIDGAENMTFENFYIIDYGASLSRIFRNCKFVVNIPYAPEIVFYNGVYVMGQDVEFTDCDFVFPKLWVGLYVRKYNSVLIKNCTFNSSGTGDAWHNIRLDEPNIVDAKVTIIGNIITGGTTGIFIAPSQNIPMKGGLIEGNRLYNQKEESIAMDGYGNDAGMIPVICNGPIASPSNDVNGNLVISMAQMYYNNNKPSPVSLRTDWNNFYFSFGTGSGMEGTIVKIKGFDAVANTLTLDTVLVASSVTAGGDGGVQSGFFNWTIRGNIVSGVLGANNTYGTAISIYLNVFGMLVENNTVTNCAHGLNLAGGLMLTHYRTLAYNNVVRNNTFTDCDKYAVGVPSEEIGVVRFVSYWGGNGPLQYNNKFENNIVNGGRIFIERQRNLSYTGNTLTNVTEKIVDSQ
jgi:hypothetical protein